MRSSIAKQIRKQIKEKFPDISEEEFKTIEKGAKAVWKKTPKNQKRLK